VKRRREPRPTLTALERAIVADLAKSRLMDALATRMARAWLAEDDDQDRDAGDARSRARS